MVEPLVVMREARKDYVAHGMPVAALAPTTCVIAPGDRIALRGPSGSGKSTVLNLVAGLDRPTAGTVTWPAFAPDLPLPRHAGAAFQMASLIPALSALDNVTLPLRLMGKTDGVEAEARVALSRFGIEALAERLPSEMSGGQIQRAALARAIVARPRLILADEPTGQLDAATARSTVAALLAAAEDCGAALVVATHDSAVAAAMNMNWTMSYGKLTIAIGELAA